MNSIRSLWSLPLSSFYCSPIEVGSFMDQKNASTCDNNIFKAIAIDKTAESWAWQLTASTIGWQSWNNWVVEKVLHIDEKHANSSDVHTFKRLQCNRSQVHKEYLLSQKLRYKRVIPLNRGL